MPDEEDPRHDPGAALAAIKAIHAAGGRTLGRDEAIAFLTRPINMGMPKALDKAPGVRGPKRKKTQYDLAFERRRDLYRKLVKLPSRNRAAGWEAWSRYRETLQAVLTDKTIPVRQRGREVVNRLAKAGLLPPPRRTVSRHLAAAKDSSPGK